MEKLKSKLSVWKAKMVLESLPTYYMSIFDAPVGVINSLEKIRRQFVWGGPDCNKSINWIAWEKIMSPKSLGGLGLGSIRALNLALLTSGYGN